MTTEKKIGQIKEELQAAEDTSLPFFIEEYEPDTRTGVQKLVEQAKKRLQKLEAEKKRIYALQEYERKYPDAALICGIDEVGRGPLAGPVVAGAVILPKNCEILYINDSKKLSEKKREELFLEIQQKAIAIGVGMASVEVIDEKNILNATYDAMRDAIKKLSVRPDVLLNDAVRIPEVDIPQVPIIKGDAKSMSIAAASIVAKVTRDHMMEEFDQIYPGYDFAGNKGYGTQKHIEGIQTIGLCPIHRRTFVKNFLSQSEKTPTSFGGE